MGALKLENAGAVKLLVVCGAAYVGAAYVGEVYAAGAKLLGAEYELKAGGAA